MLTINHVEEPGIGTVPEAQASWATLHWVTWLVHFSGHRRDEPVLVRVDETERQLAQRRLLGKPPDQETSG